MCTDRKRRENVNKCLDTYTQELRNEDTDGQGVQVYEQGHAYIDRQRDIGVYQIFGTRKRKQKGGCEKRTDHKTYI